MIVKLRISDITIPQGLLPRTITSTVEEVVERYAEAIEQGAEFPPIKVWRKSDNEYWIVDGVHRMQAHKKLGKEYIDAELVYCHDELDYRVNAIKENLKHGLPLTREERRENARKLYLSGIKNIESLAKLFGVSVRTIYGWIADLKDEEKEKLIQKVKELREQGLTQEQIAKELGVSKRTIIDWLNGEKIANLQNLHHLQESTQTEEEDDYSWVWEAVDEMDKEEKNEKDENKEIDIQIHPIKILGTESKKEKTPPDPDELYENYIEMIEQGLSYIIDKFGKEEALGVISKLQQDIVLNKYKNWRGWRILAGLKKIRGW